MGLDQAAGYAGGLDSIASIDGGEPIEGIVPGSHSAEFTISMGNGAEYTAQVGVELSEAVLEDVGVSVADDLRDALAIKHFRISGDYRLAFKYGEDAQLDGRIDL